AMGKSRSTTLLIAYLLSANPSLTPDSALSLIRQCRPFAEPNPGFMSQLELYHKLGCPADLDAEPAYQSWRYRRTVNESLARGQAPDANELRYGDEGKASRRSGGEGTEGSVQGQQEPAPAMMMMMTYRCRRCRQVLASTSHILKHTPKPPTTSKTFNSESSAQLVSQPCAHLFLDQPLSWMRAEIEQGKLEGRLECPNQKCKMQVWELERLTPLRRGRGPQGGRVRVAAEEEEKEEEKEEEEKEGGVSDFDGRRGSDDVKQKVKYRDLGTFKARNRSDWSGGGGHLKIFLEGKFNESDEPSTSVSWVKAEDPQIGVAHKVDTASSIPTGPSTTSSSTNAGNKGMPAFYGKAADWSKVKIERANFM
ncbi:MAG: hypothetical protein Q9217_005476, partial [Psora testacea]